MAKAGCSVALKKGLDVETARKFKKITSDHNTIEVEYPGYKVSDKPMLSIGYANCNGVVLFDHGFAGLSHYDLETDVAAYLKPEAYIIKMIDELHRLSGRKDLKAVLIGGEPAHFKANKEILRREGIEVVNWYCDDFSYESKRENGTDIKDVVVVPETQEVILYSKPVRYVMLSGRVRRRK